MENSGLDLNQWIAKQLGTQHCDVHPLPGDASFRTYFRAQHNDKSYIVMLAPPAKERTDEFVSIAKAWHQEGLLVPEVLAWEREKGFVLLSDFGDTLLLSRLNAQSVNEYYQDALSAIVHLQNTDPKITGLPLYNADYARMELNYFQEWFIHKLLGLTNSPEEEAVWQTLCKDVLNSFCGQPQVTVHRDFHSRNLMVLPNESLGIIDFQDAMVGPITYDAVSLLKDCYITWPTTDIHRWVGAFYEKLKAQGKLSEVSHKEFIQWFDWVGLQRHIKVLGIFSRLKLRDNKSNYLTHLPRIMRYVLEVTRQYDNFAIFHDYLETKIVPLMYSKLSKHNVHFEIDEKVA